MNDISTRHSWGERGRVHAQPSAYRVFGVVVSLVALSFLVTGCPTYKDKHSGSFREANISSTQQRAIQVDLFRYGNYARAVLRYYEPDIVDGDPFGEETFCTWTSADSFKDGDGSFELPITRSSRIDQGRLTGSVSGDSMTATLFDTESGSPIWEQREFKRVESDPVEECDFVGDFLMRANFDLSGQQSNSLPPSAGHQVDNPVFSVQWVGIEPYTDPDTGDQFLAALNAQGHAARLEERRFDEQQQALSGRLSLSLRPPEDQVLVRNGETRYALGHTIVVDDQESDGEFSWAGPPSEPIVAASIEQGVRPGSPVPQANMFGRAIFFVEGDLEELGTSLKNRIQGIDKVAQSQTPDAHFFLVDVAARDDEVLQISLPDKPIASRTIPLKMTDEFLNAGPADLPRLFPYD